MKPNIIFVLLDGSRWDRLEISSKFEELKKEGFLFNNVSTVYPYTFASMNSIFTGLYGKENGVDAYYKMFRLKDSVDYLPDFSVILHNYLQTGLSADEAFYSISESLGYGLFSLQICRFLRRGGEDIPMK